MAGPRRQGRAGRAPLHPPPCRHPATSLLSANNALVHTQTCPSLPRCLHYHPPSIRSSTLTSRRPSAHLDVLGAGGGAGLHAAQDLDSEEARLFLVDLVGGVPYWLGAGCWGMKTWCFVLMGPDGCPLHRPDGVPPALLCAGLRSNSCPGGPHPTPAPSPVQCKKHNVDCSPPQTTARLLDKLVGEFIESQVGSVLIHFEWRPLCGRAGLVAGPCAPQRLPPRCPARRRTLSPPLRRLPARPPCSA